MNRGSDDDDENDSDDKDVRPVTIMDAIKVHPNSWVYKLKELFIPFMAFIVIIVLPSLAVWLLNKIHWAR